MRLLIVAALLIGGAHGVPVVPSFSQGSMTSRTETRSSVTEVINSMDYSTGYSWSASGHNVKSNTGSLSAGTGTTSSSVGDGISAEWTNMNMSNKPTWSIVNLEKVSPWSRLITVGAFKPDNYSVHNRSRKHYRNYIGLSTLILFIVSVANAADIGGVSATANPVAQTSGSQTNPAVQNLSGPYAQSALDLVVCQGPTLSLSPFVHRSLVGSFPIESLPDPCDN